MERKPLFRAGGRESCSLCTSRHGRASFRTSRRGRKTPLESSFASTGQSQLALTGPDGRRAPRPGPWHAAGDGNPPLPHAVAGPTAALPPDGPTAHTHTHTRLVPAHMKDRPHPPSRCGLPTRHELLDVTAFVSKPLLRARPRREERRPQAARRRCPDFARSAGVGGGRSDGCALPAA
eukprot:366444-Chlamydomonas_euryale.AAC.33